MSHPFLNSFFHQYPAARWLVLIIVVFVDKAFLFPNRMRTAAHTWARKNGFELLTNQTSWDVPWERYLSKKQTLKITVRDSSNEIHSGWITLERKLRFRIEVAEIKWDGDSAPKG